MQRLDRPRTRPSSFSWRFTSALLASCLMVCLAVGPGSAVRAQSALRSFQSIGNANQPVDLLANKAEYDLDGHWATFIGNVVIRSGGQELRADRIRFNTDTYEAKAFGRVTLVGPDGSVWSGDSLNVNLKERSGSAGNMDVYYKPFKIEAAKGEVVGDTYVAEDVLMTTCTNAPGHYHYHMSAGRIRVRPDRDLTAYRAVPHLFGVPVFFWPYYWKDLNRHYGFRFEPGYRSRWGAYLLTTYKMRVYRDEDNRWIDSRTALDWRSKRGWAYGERLNWYLQEFGDGWLSAYFADDDKRPLHSEVEDPERYRFRLNHALDLSARDRVLLQGLYVSDTQVMADFFEKEYREMRQPDNHLSYTHTARDYSFGVVGRLRLNDFYEQVERLPEAWLNVNQRELGATGIYYENQNKAGFLRKQFDERPEPPTPSYDAARVDTWHQLSVPLKFAGFLNLIPRASYRGTSYSVSRETYDEVQTTLLTATNALGVVSTTAESRTNSVTREAGAVFRNVIELGAETSFKAYGMWDAQDGTQWRHVVEPYSNYTYIPEPDVLPGQLYQFDSIDEIDFTHQVRLGLRNRWQYKKGDRAHEVAMVDVYGDLRLEPDEDEDALEAINLESEFFPSQWMRWDFDATYSLTDSQVESSTTRMVMWHDRISAAFEYVYRVDESSLATGDLTWSLTSEWDANLFGRYEFETALVEEIGGYLQRRYDCIAFRLCASVQPGYERSDGTQEEDDYRISFVSWLTHFPPDSVLESDYR